MSLITMLENDKIFYLMVESHYFDISNAKGKEDAVLFEMGQYNEHKKEIDSVLTCSVNEAKEFAKSIIELCEKIES